MKKSTFKENNQQIFRWMFKIFVIWRIGLELVVFLGKKILPEKLDYLGPSVWANFDGVYYLNIAQNGYGLYQQAFFPFYPFLIRWLSNFIHNYLVSGLLISHLAFLGALVFLYKLLTLDYSPKFIKLVIIGLLLFPASFYFVSVYTESLFLFFVLGAFYFIRIKKWWLGGVFGAFASATRIVGIFLLPALLIEWWEDKKILNFKFKILNLIFLFLIPLGLIFYMRYLLVHYGDPLLFIHVQPHFGAQRSGGKIILLYQVFWRYFKMILTTKIDPLYFVVWLELLVAISFLGLLVYGYLKKIRLSYLVFGFLAYILPTLTGTFSSLPRYVLVVFPAFLSLGFILEKYQRFKIFYLIFSLILLVISLIFFSRGYWLA
ncbi:MAG: hypothetical protein ACPLKP_01300 [Microgenomates group bacterium]